MENNKVNKNKFLSALVAILLVLVVVVSFLLGYFAQFIFKNSSSKLVEEVSERIVGEGVILDENNNIKKLSAEEALSVLLGNTMDEYSRYYTPAEYEEIKKSNEGDYAGVGVRLSNLKIKEVIYNSPAYKTGLKEGDFIVGAKAPLKERVDFTSGDEFSEFLTTVKLGEEFSLYLFDGSEREVIISKNRYTASYVLYRDSQKTLEFLSKDYAGAPEKTIKDEGNPMLDDNTAYIKLVAFEGNAAGEDPLGETIKYMKERGKTKLLLDLRGNGGGQMVVLTQIASYLIYNKGVDNSIITWAQGTDRMTHFSTLANNFNTDMTAIVVLADESSASATECLIGAMLHYGDRFSVANLVIQNKTVVDNVAKTFGKGIMQTTYSLSNGGALKITTALLYQPNMETCIHKIGIKAHGLNAVETDERAMNRATEILAEYPSELAA